MPAAVGRASPVPEAMARMRAWQAPRLVERQPGPYHPDRYTWGSVAVPAESLFVMSDSRDASYDGGSWGFLPRGSLRGAARCLLQLRPGELASLADPDRHSLVPPAVGAPLRPRRGRGGSGRRGAALKVQVLLDPDGSHA